MSTGKYSLSEATITISLEELRAQQEREAQRERERLRLAQQELAEQDRQFRRLVLQLDQAARRLPDLSLMAPEWPAPPSDANSTAGAERYLYQLRVFVSDFEGELARATRTAEEILANRLALAEAKREESALIEAIKTLHADLANILEVLGEGCHASNLPPYLPTDASLADVQTRVQALKTSLMELRNTLKGARARVATQERAQDLGGQKVAPATTADAVLNIHAQTRLQQARASLEGTLKRALADHNFSLADLPEGTRLLLEAALDAPEATPERSEALKRWVAREWANNNGIAIARKLIASAPDLLHARPNRSIRWNTLVQSLEKVAAGLEPLIPWHEQEHSQIAQDAQRDVGTLFAQTAFVESLRAKNFEVYTDEDGRLQIVDLQNPNISYVQDELVEINAVSNGASAAEFVLETDTGAVDLDAVADACDRFTHVVAGPESKEQVKVAAETTSPQGLIPPIVHRRNRRYPNRFMYARL